jgi:hypothetical protein
MNNLTFLTCARCGKLFEKGTILQPSDHRNEVPQILTLNSFNTQKTRLLLPLKAAWPEQLEETLMHFLQPGKNEVRLETSKLFHLQGQTCQL